MAELYAGSATLKQIVMEKIEPKFGVLSSSADNQRLSLTIKSAIPLVIFGLSYFGYAKITTSDLENLVSAIGVIISACFTAYGLIRKIYFAFK
jgi:hypothetical protein